MLIASIANLVMTALALETASKAMNDTDFEAAIGLWVNLAKRMEMWILGQIKTRAVQALVVPCSG